MLAPHEVNIDKVACGDNMGMTTAGATGLIQPEYSFFLLGPRSKSYHQRYTLRHYKLSIRSSPSITRILLLRY